MGKKKPFRFTDDPWRAKQTRRTSTAPAARPARGAVRQAAIRTSKEH